MHDLDHFRARSGSRRTIIIPPAGEISPAWIPARQRPESAV